MKTATLSALLRRTRRAAKAVALPCLLTIGVGTAASILVPRAAQAQVSAASVYNCTVFGNGTTDCVPTQLGDKLVTPAGINLIGGAPRDVSVSFEWFDPTGPFDNDFSDDSWSLSVGNPTGTVAFSGPFDLTFSYYVDIVSGPDFNGFIADGEPWFFDTFALDTDVPSQTASVVVIKDVETGEIVLTSSNGVPDPAPGDPSAIIGPNLKRVLITDRLTVAQGARLFRTTNTWTQRKPNEVPGPLPILGAGVAFGFSRKLRRRIATVPSA